MRLNHPNWRVAARQLSRPWPPLISVRQSNEFSLCVSIILAHRVCSSSVRFAQSHCQRIAERDLSIFSRLGRILYEQQPLYCCSACMIVVVFIIIFIFCLLPVVRRGRHRGCCYCCGWLISLACISDDLVAHLLHIRFVCITYMKMRCCEKFSSHKLLSIRALRVLYCNRCTTRDTHT